MGLREKFMVKQVFGAGAFNLEAKAGKSILVKDIFIYRPVSDWLTIRTNKTTVGFFRIDGDLGNHLPIPIGAASHSHGLHTAAADGALTEDHALYTARGMARPHLAIFSDYAVEHTEADLVTWGYIPKSGYQTILGFLAARGLFNGFPIAEGQTMTLTGVAQAVAGVICVYEEYDAQDVKASDPNGSDSLEYLFMNYGRPAAAVTTTATTIYDTPQTTAEFPDFPFGKDAPAKAEIDLLGICASDAVDYRSAADSMGTTYLKLVRDRVVLFDDDKNGLMLRGRLGWHDTATHFGRGLSLFGNCSDEDQKPPLMFDPPLTFLPGEELGIYISTLAGAAIAAASLSAADLEIALIERVRRK